MIRKMKTGLFIAQELALRAADKRPHVLDTLSSLKVLSSENVSISRYGDGEFKLIAGESLKFQPFNRELQRRLVSILNKPQNTSHCVAVPYAVRSVKGLTARSSKFWLYHCREIRTTVYPLFDMSYEYLDAQISRFYINRKNRNLSEIYLSKWRTLWNNRDVLIVEGTESRFGAGNNLLDNARSIKRILCPPVDAWARYTDLLNATLEHADACDLVLLALGPTATVLAYDLALNNVWAIDSGNLDMEYEWMMRGSRKQEAIKGKYTLEAIGGMQVANFRNEQYEHQIIETIV